MRDDGATAEISRKPIDMTRRRHLSIIVKALNEATKIGACLASCARESAHLDAEIIVIDSLSTDATVDVATRFGVTVVQFERAEDCGPGAAVELGFRYSTGEYIYVIDGDMEIEAGFLRTALAWLGTHSEYAGVAGRVTDVAVSNSEDHRRASRPAPPADRDVDRLAGGGLYRRADIEAVGYLAHPGLPAHEEAELGFRLARHGRRLRRLAVPGVLHKGHEVGSLELTWRRLRSGRFWTSGKFLRVAAASGTFMLALREFSHSLAALAFWAAILAATALGLPGVSASLLAVAFFIVIYLVIRKRRVDAALMSIVYWHLSALGLLVGWLQGVQSPLASIQARVIALPEQ